MQDDFALDFRLMTADEGDLVLGGERDVSEAGPTSARSGSKAIRHSENGTRRTHHGCVNRSPPQPFGVKPTTRPLSHRGRVIQPTEESVPGRYGAGSFSNGFIPGGQSPKRVNTHDPAFTSTPNSGRNSDG